MAFEAPYVAGGTINTCRFLTISSGNTVIQATGTGTVLAGISQDASARTPGLFGTDPTIAAYTGDELQVFVEGQECQITAGATFSAGVLLTSDSSGRGVVATSGQWVGMLADQASTQIGELIKGRVIICKA